MNYYKVLGFLIFSFFVNISYGQITVEVKQNSLGKLSNDLIQISNSAFLNNKYLKSAGRFKIILSIESNKTGISSKGDGFSILAQGSNTLLISGSNNNGVQNGVYFFLEKFLGVYFLLPGDVWVEFTKPELELNSKEIKIVEQPKFLMRYLSPMDPNKSNDYGNFANRNRLNYIIDYRHNLYNLFDSGDTQSFTPIVKGKKAIRNGSSDQRWQPRFFQKGIVEYSANKIIKYFKSSPNATTFSLSINDSQNFDDNTKSEGINFLGMKSYSNEYYSWVNSTINLVNKNIGDGKLFGVLAYNNVITPPSFKLPNNVVPFITYERFRWLKPDQRKFDLNNLNNWLKVSNNIGWYDYVYGINYLAPRSYFDLISTTLKEGNKLGVKYYVAELYPNSLEGPKAWIMSKLLWNPNQNTDQLLKEWCEMAVGKNSSLDLYNFYKLWESYWTNIAINSDWYRNDAVYQRFNDQSYTKSIPLNYLVQSNNLLNSVLNKAENDIYKKRATEILKIWEISELSIQYFKDGSKNSKTKQKILDLLEKLPENQMNTEYKIFFKKHTKL